MMADVIRFPDRPTEGRARDHAWGNLLDRVRDAIAGELAASKEQVDAAGLDLFAADLLERADLMLDEAWASYSERVHGPDR